MSSKPTEYSSGLLWFTREGDQITLGVTDAALEELGSVESVEFAEPGDEFAEGDWVAELAGANATVEMVAPVSLVVSEVNEEIGREPQTLADDPTGDGWILRASVKESP